VLIVIAGLPATGKTTLAAALARRLSAVHLSVDHAEEALLRAGLPPDWTTGVAAYEVVGAAALQNLSLGAHVVVDAVNDSEPARQTWRAVASSAGVELRFVLLHPPGAAEHQRRLRDRRRGLTHVTEPTWAQVTARAEAYEAWPDEPLELSATAPVDELLARLLEQLGQPLSAGGSDLRA
jgi:predicted kinase